MISSWICCVPSNRSRIFASRAHFSSSSPSPKPVGAAQRDAAQRDVGPDPARLGLGHRRLQRVGPAVVGHPRRLQGQQPRGLPLGLHRDELGGGGALVDAARTAVVVDLDPGLARGARACASRHARATPIAIPATIGRVLSNVCIAPAKPLRVSISGLPSRFSLGHAAVLEHEVGGVRGADPELVLEPLELETGVGALDHERLDRRPPLGPVERRPDDDQLGSVAGGDEDLRAVEDVLVAVEAGGRADRRRVRAGLGLGDRHRRPLAAEPLELLVVGDGGDRRLAEALAGHRQHQPDVAPAQLDQAQQAGHVRAVAVDRSGAAPSELGAAADGPDAGAGHAAALGHAVDQRRQHVELLGVLVLGGVVMAGVGTEHVDRDLMGLADQRLELAWGLEVDHRRRASPPSSIPAARRSRYQRSTGCSLT